MNDHKRRGEKGSRQITGEAWIGAGLFIVGKKQMDWKTGFNQGFRKVQRTVTGKVGG